MFSVVLFTVALFGREAYSAAIGTAKQPIYNGELALQGNIPDVALPFPYPTDDELPASWDWRSRGLMTTDLNQHIPVYW